MTHAGDRLDKYPFLKRGGEMAGLIAEKNWNKTSLGPIDKWSETLKTAVAITLNTTFPKLLLWGPELICIYNDAYKLFLGTGAKHPRMLGLGAKEAWPENWNRMQELISEIHQGKTHSLIENMPAPIFRNGRMENAFWTYSISAVPDPDGEVAGVLFTVIETTGQNQLIEDLKKSAAKFESFIFDIPIGILKVKCPDYEIELINNSACLMIDRNRLDVIGKPFFNLFPEIEDRIKPLFEILLQTRKPYYGNEFRVELMRHGKKQTAYFNLVFDPAFDANGDLKTITLLSIEVTDFIEQRNYLQQSEKKFKKMIHDSPIGMTILRGPDLIIEMANVSMATKVWGLDVESVIGRPLLELFPELKNQKYSKQLEKVLESGKIISEVESKATLVQKGKEITYYFDYEYAPLTDTDSLTKGVMVTAYDVTEKVIAKIKQEDIKERLEIAIEATGLATWEFIPQEDKFTYSANLPEILQISEEKNYSQQDLMDLIIPEDRKVRIKAWEEAWKTGIIHYEVRFRIADNEIIWLSVRGKLFYDKDKNLKRVLGTLRNITIEKNSHRALQKSEQRLRRLILQAPVAIGILRGPNFRIEIINQTALTLLGKSENQMLNQPALDVMKEFDQDIAREMLESVYYQGKTISATEFPIKVMRNGNLEKIYINFEYDPIKNNNGDVIGVMVVGSDITGQVLARKKVEQSESRFRLLANNIAQLVWTTNKEGVISYLNQTMQIYIHGREAKDIFNWFEKIHPDEKTAVLKKWNSCVQSGNPFIDEHRLLRYDKEYRWHLTRANPLIDKSGNIGDWVATGTDIQELKELDQEKDFFISRASHELKTPITSIKGYVQILQSMYKNSDEPLLTNSLDRINVQVDKLRVLISDLLDVTKLNSGIVSLKYSEFKINKLIRECIEDVMYISPEAAIKFDPCEDIIVHADRERINQVLLNLLTNAVKYSINDSNIKISTSVQENKIVVSVKDHGIGIKNDYQKKVFEKFYRVQGKNEETFPGFGIGLFIASEIIKKHNGKIWVESELGKGSTFYFEFPSRP